MATRDCLIGEELDKDRTRRASTVVRPPARRRIPFALAVLLSGLLVAPPDGLAGQPAQHAAPSVSQAEGDAAQDIEAEGNAVAPVLLSGEEVVWVLAGIGPFTPQARADRIAQRLEAIVADKSIDDPRVTIANVRGSAELRIGQNVVMVITVKDGEAAGVAPQLLAPEYARRIEAAIRAERLRYAPAALVRSSAYAAVATLAFLAVVWFIGLVTNWLHRRLAARRGRGFDSLRLQQLELVSAARITRAIHRLATVVRIVLVLAVLEAYLTYVLGLFPWTRALSFQLYGYAMAPIRTLVVAFVGYLPKLTFVVLIAVVIYSAIRFVAFFFAQIRDGRIVFANFPAEWALPTNTIVRVLLIALGLVVAFPYLPASGSPAFAGVSVFMGVLLSLASSSALSNMIAGLVLTYAGAFRLGDRVKVGDAVGDIVEQSLLATRIRTIKNEEVTIPNGIVIGSSVTNYTRQAQSRGLILHTSVTIGYDAPWRVVHELLLRAAAATPGLLQDPSPFVWQTALNDFYVTYELNAYTATPHDMDGIYAVLHGNIQDAFNQAGVEIMSPHYTALRDGNTVTIPESHRPPGYRPPMFRVDGVSPASDR